jgi:CHASE3 domain sensor protein
MTRISRFNIAAVLYMSAIISLTIAGFWVYNLYQHTFDMNFQVTRDYQTIQAANQSLLAINNVALEVSIFLISKDVNAISKISPLIISANANIAALQQLIQDNPVEIQIFNHLQPLVEKKISFLQRIMTEYTSGNQAAALQLAASKDRIQLTERINQLILDIKKIEMEQMNQSSAAYDQYKIDANKFFILFRTINILLFIFLYLYIRQYLKRYN